MKRNPGLLLAVGLVVALAGGSSAEPPQVEQIHFDTTVMKERKIVWRTAVLVKMGDAKMSLVGQGEVSRRFGLTYKVDESSGSGYTAQVTTLLDGKEVASGTLLFGGDQAAGVMLDGGGHVWMVTAERITREKWKRRKVPKRKPADQTECQEAKGLAYKGRP
jgi:hypothetical protein